jgi:lipopolysaccharide export system ATP-binding protein
MLLKADDLFVTVQGRTLVRGVSVHLAPGEVVGLLGPSGAGKSMVFRAIAGEITATKGRLSLAGSDVTHAPMWQRIRAGLGYIPQDPSVFLNLTVKENLEAFARLAARPSQPQAQSLPALSAQNLGLEHAEHTLAGALSAGERRRLELGRALATSPRILLCDEPFAGVDPKSARELGDRLQRYARDHNAAVLLADHHVREALRVCDRAVLLLDGRIECEAPALEFAEQELVRTRYLGA